MSRNRWNIPRRQSLSVIALLTLASPSGASAQTGNKCTVQDAANLAAIENLKMRRKALIEEGQSGTAKTDKALQAAQSVVEFTDKLPDWADVYGKPTASSVINPDTLTQEVGEIISPGNADPLWLGNIIQGKSLLSGNIEDIQSVHGLSAYRKPFKVNLKLLSNNKGDPKVEDVSQTGVADVIDKLMTWDNLDAQSAGYGSDGIKFYSVDESSKDSLDVATKLKFSFAGAKADASVGYKKDASQRTYVYYLVDKRFTVSADFNENIGADAVFTEELTMETLRQKLENEGKLKKGVEIGVKNLPVIVSSITYGRMLVFKVTSSYSKEEIDVAVKASYKKAGLDVSGEVALNKLKDSSKTTIQVDAVGGDVKAIEELIKTGKLAEYFNTKDDTHFKKKFGKSDEDEGTDKDKDKDKNKKDKKKDSKDSKDTKNTKDGKGKNDKQDGKGSKTNQDKTNEKPKDPKKSSLGSRGKQYAALQSATARYAPWRVMTDVLQVAAEDASDNKDDDKNDDGSENKKDPDADNSSPSNPLRSMRPIVVTLKDFHGQTVGVIKSAKISAPVPPPGTDFARTSTISGNPVLVNTRQGSKGRSFDLYAPMANTDGGGFYKMYRLNDADSAEYDKQGSVWNLETIFKKGQKGQNIGLVNGLAVIRTQKYEPRTEGIINVEDLSSFWTNEFENGSKDWYYRGEWFVGNGTNNNKPGLPGWAVAGSARGIPSVWENHNKHIMTLYPVESGGLDWRYQDFPNGNKRVWSPITTGIGATHGKFNAAAMVEAIGENRTVAVALNEDGRLFYFTEHPGVGWSVTGEAIHPDFRGSGNLALIETFYGANRYYELVVPPKAVNDVQPNGVYHMRSKIGPGGVPGPWSCPQLILPELGNVRTVSMIQGQLGAGDDKDVQLLAQVGQIFFMINRVGLNGWDIEDLRDKRVVWKN